uniref:Uncharacterized protein n=1 Tax=Xenopus tropicalis TaxID=8364 RepID=A0A803K3M9_XENTR
LGVNFSWRLFPRHNPRQNRLLWPPRPTRLKRPPRPQHPARQQHPPRPQRLQRPDLQRPHKQRPPRPKRPDLQRPQRPQHQPQRPHHKWPQRPQQQRPHQQRPPRPKRPTRPRTLPPFIPPPVSPQAKRWAPGSPAHEGPSVQEDLANIKAELAQLRGEIIEGHTRTQVQQALSFIFPIFFPFNCKNKSCFIFVLLN